MYFSSLVKQELARIMPESILEQKGELLAFIRFKGFLSKPDKYLSLILEKPIMIKIVYYLFKKVFKYELDIKTIRKGNKKKNFIVSVPDFRKTKYILDSFNLEVDASSGLLIEKQKTEASKNIFFAENIYSYSAFLRGAFLTDGFVNDPERMYHLEISCYRKQQARIIHDILETVSFSAKISRWQKRWAVYIKKSEQIFEFLRFIGVQRALLNFQDIIARKELLNKINRLVNCETANLDKTILSASRQLLYIDVLKQHISMDNLSNNLKEVIKARLDNPYGSIQELANDIGGGISKSGVYHRLKKIEELAESYMEEENYIAENRQDKPIDSTLTKQ
jgi:cell division protein WhiA